MATYTLQEYGEQMDAFLKGWPKVVSEAGFIASKNLEVNMKSRIFNRGESALDDKIGKYSTTPTLIGAKSFPNKTTARKVFGSKRKRSNLEWRKVKGNNLAILEGGYKEIRKISGLRTDTVDLNFKGDLQRSIRFGKKKYIWTIKIKGIENIMKKRGNEDRFGKPIFEASKKEEKRLREDYREEINKYINKFFD